MSNEDLRDLKRFAVRVEDELRAFFEQLHEEVPRPRTGPGADAMLAAVQDLTLRGGKRVRAGLAYFAALSVQPEETLPGLLGACASLELLQSYLLIHDDIMDQDDLRRGGPTVHRMLGDGDPQQGQIQGILAGDLAAAMTRWMLDQSIADPVRRSRAARELNRMEWDVIHGQFLDVTGSPDVDTMHDLKTSSYSTRGPMRLGGVLAGADEAQLATFEAYGTPLGAAFQLRDDLIDFTGDPAKTGKPQGTDLREGRVSSVIREALELAQGEQHQLIERAWGQHELSAEGLAEAVAAIHDSGAIDACAERVRGLTEEAIVALDGGGLRDEGVLPLQRIARALAARVH